MATTRLPIFEGFYNFAFWIEPNAVSIYPMFYINFQVKALQEASFYGLVSKDTMQSPFNTRKVVELPFTKGCYYVAYCGGPGTFNSLVVDYYQSRPNELIQGHAVNVLDLMVK